MVGTEHEGCDGHARGRARRNGSPTGVSDHAVGPVVLGGGNPAFSAHTRTELELLDERRFGNGVVLLRYRVL
jgi:hypothetical protein